MDADESALYDRQIRLYGLSGQQKYPCICGIPLNFRIRRGKIAILGDWEGTLQEILKNLVLNGVGMITLYIRSFDDSTLGIFGKFSEAQANAHDMNPGVVVSVVKVADFSTIPIASSASSHVIYVGNSLDITQWLDNEPEIEHASWTFGNERCLHLINDFGDYSYHQSTRFILP